MFGVSKIFLFKESVKSTRLTRHSTYTVCTHFIIYRHLMYQIFRRSVFDMFGEWITDIVLLVRSLPCTKLQKAC